MTLVSTKVLRKLIEAALEGVEFDEKWYLKQYGDIADAHRKGQIVNLREHFITSGYFEGRRPSGRHFDAWRSEERRAGKASVSTCRSRWSPNHDKTKTHIVYK